MMKTQRSALRPALAALACVSIAACAQKPPQQTDLEYQSRQTSAARKPTSAPGASDQRLTIQSGEGEKLNLPWFIQDTQDWVNSN